MTTTLADPTEAAEVTTTIAHHTEAAEAAGGSRQLVIFETLIAAGWDERRSAQDDCRHVRSRARRRCP